MKIPIPQDIENLNKINQQSKQFPMNNQFNNNQIPQCYQTNISPSSNNMTNNLNNLNTQPNDFQKLLNLNFNLDNNMNQNNIIGKMFEPQKPQNFIPNSNKNDLDFLLNPPHQNNQEHQNNNFLDPMLSTNLLLDNPMLNINNLNNQPLNLNINNDKDNNNNNQKGMDELQKQIWTMQLCNDLQKKSLDVLYQYIGQFYKEVDYHNQINEFQRGLINGKYFMGNPNQINFYKPMNQQSNRNQNESPNQNPNLNPLENQIFNQNNNSTNINNIENPMFNQFNH